MIKDLLHIGDSQNSQWWGALQGLSLNGVNQELRFTADSAFQSIFNQNKETTIELTSKNSFVLSNRINTIQGIFVFYDVNTNNANYFSYVYVPNIITDRRTSALSSINSFLPPRLGKLSHSVNYYDGNRNSSTGFKQYINGNYLASLAGSGQPDLLLTDNIYSISSTFFIGRNWVNNMNIPCVFRDLRIYTSMLTNEQVRNKYHSLPDNAITPYCEWKCASPSDFYVFGGNLFARNTGSSGNGLDNGTGYDMQVIGMGTTPNFATLY